MARGPRGALAALAALAACGPSPAGGAGNGALAVTCEVLYSPVAGTSRRAQADTSLVRAEVRRAGVPVAGATLTLTDLDRQERLDLGGAGGELSGRWAGYRRRLVLEARDGDDFVSCALEGPGRHVVVEPTLGALARRDRALAVSWRHEAGEDDDGPSDRTDCALASGYLATTSRDEARLEVPGEQLLAGAEAVEVVRHREMVPAGAAPGSRFRISYGVRVPFVAR